MFTSAHVCNLALRYWFLLWCGFNLYTRLVIRWCGVGILELACVHCIFTWRQKDSSLEVKSPDWQHMESSCMYIYPACSWCNLGVLDLKDTCFESLFSFISVFRINFLLVGWHLLIVFTWIPLVALLSWLERFTFLLILAWWEVCFLMSYQIDLGCLRVTCNLF